MFKKIILTAVLGILTFSFLLTPNVSAAKFYSTDNNGDVKVEASNENVYAAGQNVTVDKNVAKDVVLAGSKIEITGIVGRSIFAAGDEIKIDSKRVSGAVRVAGNKVTIKGNFSEEIIVTGNEVIIEDARIQGDLIVAANKLTLKNSIVVGDGKISYTELNGDLNSQIRGEKQIQKNEQKDSFKNFDLLFALAGVVSSIAFLLIAGFFLSKRKILELEDIKLNSNLAVNMVVGFAMVILAIPIFIISIIAQLYPLTFVLVGLIYLAFSICGFYLPIYVANLVKNQFNVKLKFAYLIAISFVIITILLLIPIVNILFGFIFLLLQFACFGYLTSKFFKAFNNMETDNKKMDLETKPESTIIKEEVKTK